MFNTVYVNTNLTRLFLSCCQLLMVQHLILRTPQADPIPHCFLASLRQCLGSILLVVFKDCIIFMEASTCQMCLVRLHPERPQWVLYHQMPHGSGVTNRGGINVVGNHAFSSSNIDEVTGSIIGISSSSASGNRSSVPGLGVSPVLGNVGPRLTSSVGNIVGSGNMGRSISSGGLSLLGGYSGYQDGIRVGDVGFYITKEMLLVVGDTLSSGFPICWAAGICSGGLFRQQWLLEVTMEAISSVREKLKTAFAALSPEEIERSLANRDGGEDQRRPQWAAVIMAVGVACAAVAAAAGKTTHGCQ
ncbi:hypothetical protein ZIOFF_024614 [Zingiber officinale]|uniref:Uncharacterized protein n=1 Tax=Zingiber officinale TaxID=94328 RepID=A0A8J5GSQ1_ZINOF|nr:hypothetical protein ZIOFF_024614 [Zingiber officinale]